VLLAIVIGAIYAGRYGAYALVILLAGLALWEFRSLSDGMGSRAPGWLLYPLGAFFAFSGTVLKQVDVNIVLSLALVGGLAAFLVVPGRRQGLGRWAMGLAGALYIGMPFNYYLVLYTSQPHGLVWALFIIFAVVANDTMALLVGSRIGRHPFFPMISPRKTVEGAVAGVVGSVIVMLVGVTLIIGLEPIHAIALGILVGVSAQVGDLVESQMKRIAEVKDSSNLIPGHGGVLDRLDSILFPPILVYFYVTMFHILQ
jgi:phosphatidate cytidylyltransferase